MSRYGWEIQTSDTPGAGTDAKVFLSLEGERGKTQEMYLADPNSINDWERGDLNSGTFQTVELGSLIRGSLRHDGSGLGADWTVDLVTIRNLDTEQAWVSGVNATLKANTPFRLVFRAVWQADNPRASDKIETRLAQPLRSRMEPGESDFSVRRAVLTRMAQPSQPVEPLADEELAQASASTRPVLADTRRTGEVRRQLPAPLPERAVPRGVVQTSQPKALPPAAESAADPASEQVLSTLRAQGLNDEEILARLQAPSEAEGFPRLGAEGLSIAGTGGQLIQSDQPNYGSEYEGYSLQSAPVVKLADEDEAVEV